MGGDSTRYDYLRELVVGEVKTREFGTEAGEVQRDPLDVVVGEVELTQPIKHLLSTLGGVPLDGQVSVAYVETVVETSLSGFVGSYHLLSIVRTTSLSTFLLNE